MFSVFDGFFTQNSECEHNHGHGVSYFLPSLIQSEMQASVVNFEL